MNLTGTASFIVKYEVPSPKEQVLLQIWCHVCFLLGVLGNTFVLYATIYHKAIKMDKMSVWIIQNLAASDLANCFLVLLPNQFVEQVVLFQSFFHHLLTLLLPHIFGFLQQSFFFPLLPRVYPLIQ